MRGPGSITRRSSPDFGVTDYGVGLSENIDSNKPKSLGFELVGALSCQLGAHVEVAGNGGTMFRIRIPRK